MTDWDVDEDGVVQSGHFKGSHTKPGTVPGMSKRELVYHWPAPPTVDERGDEHHPSWVLLSVHKVTSNPGAVLFDSDIRHQHFVRVTVEQTSRKRDYHRDWLHGGQNIIEVDMSEAQWASFVSSTNTSGVPGTLRRSQTNPNIDGLLYEPRLTESMDEIKGAAAKVFGRIDEAMKEWDDLDPKAGVKERRAVQAKIRNAVAHAESNMTFAAKSLEEHAENVVQRARADIEAMVYNHAERLGLDPKQTLQDLVLDSSITPQQAIEAGGLESCPVCGSDEDPCHCEGGGL